MNILIGEAGIHVQSTKINIFSEITDHLGNVLEVVILYCDD